MLEKVTQEQEGPEPKPGWRQSRSQPQFVMKRRDHCHVTLRRLLSLSKEWARSTLQPLLAWVPKGSEDKSA